MALGILERFHRDGIKVAYVAPTQEMARTIQRTRRTDVPCLAWSLMPMCMPDPECRVIALDDTHMFDHLNIGMDALISKLELHMGPTQLIVVQPGMPTGKTMIFR